MKEDAMISCYLNIEAKNWECETKTIQVAIYVLVFHSTGFPFTQFIVDLAYFLITKSNADVLGSGIKLIVKQSFYVLF